MVETKGIDLDCVRIHDDSGEPIAERHVLEEGGKKAEAERMLVPEMESEVTPEAAVADAVDDRKRDENNWTIVEDAPDEVVAEDGKVAKRWIRSTRDTFTFLWWSTGQNRFQFSWIILTGLILKLFILIFAKCNFEFWEKVLKLNCQLWALTSFKAPKKIFVKYFS